MTNLDPSDSNNRKRKIRNVISPIEGVVVDEGDYRIVDGIFRDCVDEIQRYLRLSTGEIDENGEKVMDIRTIFDVQKDDSCRRVSQLTILESTQRSLPKSLLRLDALEALTIVPTQFPIPKWLGDMKSLQKLTIYLEEDQALPPEILSYLPNLQILEIIGETRASFPVKNGTNYNTNLKELVVSMEKVPLQVGNFSNIEILRFGPSCISIPSSIGGFRNLKRLVLEECHDLFSLPEELGQLSLQVVRIWCCSGLRFLPRSIGNITSLRVLDLEDSSGLSELPEEVENLTKLEYMNLKGCLGLSDGGSSLPIEKLENLRILNLSDLEVVLPENIGNLTKLEYLDLSHTKIDSFPTSFRKLKSLKVLNLDGCSYNNDENLQDLTGVCLSGVDMASVSNSLEYLHLYSASDCDERNKSTNKALAEPKTNTNCSFQLNVSSKGSSKQRRAL